MLFFALAEVSGQRSEVRSSAFIMGFSESKITSFVISSAFDSHNLVYVDEQILILI